MVEDIIDTGATTINAAQELKNSGATRVYAFATHALLSGNAVEKLAESELDKLVVLDTVPISKEKLEGCPKLKQVSISLVLANIIRTLHYEKKG